MCKISYLAMVDGSSEALEIRRSNTLNVLTFNPRPDWLMMLKISWGWCQLYIESMINQLNKFNILFCG